MIEQGGVLPIAGAGCFDAIAIEVECEGVVAADERLGGVEVGANIRGDPIVIDPNTGPSTCKPTSELTTSIRQYFKLFTKPLLQNVI